MYKKESKVGKSERIKKITRLALLAALALALSALESIFTPILPPGAKAGLSNIAVMLAAASLGLPAALSLALVKALFALLLRGALAFFMSLSGGVFSALALFLLFRFTGGRVGLIGISMAGAFIHNAAQGCVALFVFGTALLAYMPVLLLLSVPSGIVTGALLGAVRHIFETHERKRVRKKDETETQE